MIFEGVIKIFGKKINVKGNNENNKLNKEEYDILFLKSNPIFIEILIKSIIATVLSSSNIA